MKAFSFFKKHPMFAGVFFLLFFVSALFSLNIKTSSALAGFGGVVAAPPLYCDEGIGILVAGRPVPGLYLYNPITTVPFSYYNFFTPGTWVLGGDIPVIPPAVLPCTILGVPVAYAVGVITTIGSGMAPLP